MNSVHPPAIHLTLGWRREGTEQEDVKWRVMAGVGLVEKVIDLWPIVAGETLK